MNNICPCEKCRKQMKKGVDSMIATKRSNSFVISDYIDDMSTGGWTECENCPDYNFPEDDEE